MTDTRPNSTTNSTARLWDDGILAPAETRDALGLALDVCLRAPFDAPGYGVFRM